MMSEPDLTYSQAQAKILAGVKPLSPALLALYETLGLVLGQPAIVRDPVPPFHNSAMDGYAVRATDLEGVSADHPAGLLVLSDLQAGGSTSFTVQPKTAIRIMTGAAIPEGADTVVRKEDTRSEGNHVFILRTVPPGANIRRAGEDMRPGQTVLEAGCVLRPAEIGVLAALGQAQVCVIPPPTVAILTTGNELVPVETKPGPGQIRDANAHSMRAQITKIGARPVLFPRVPDTRDAVRDALQMAIDQADVVLANGGVSVGDYDFVKDVLAELGAELVFWRVRQKPGKPLAFWQIGGKPVFGIPGNPVSAWIAIEEYVRPALRKMMGHRLLFRPQRVARLQDPYDKGADRDRLHFLRVRAEKQEEGWWARSTGPQGSGILTSLSQANALALIPEDTTRIAAGGEVLLHMTEWPEDRE
jgi:molybdopterin molybdotransferase